MVTVFKSECSRLCTDNDGRRRGASLAAYDILRWKGVTIGKRDFMGRLRMKS
jgi:hypothetical protein